MLIRFLTTLIAIFIVSVCFASSLSFFSRHWWVFELASHFRLQYFIILFLSSLFLFLRAYYKSGVVVGIFAFVNLITLVPFETVVHAKSPGVIKKGESYRAVLVNVDHGSNEFTKLNEYVRSVHPDFLVLLEVNERWMAKLQELREKFPYSKGQVHPEYGILFMSRIPIDQASILYFGEEKIPTVMAQIAIRNEENFIILGTHPRSPMGSDHSRSRNEQLKSIGKLVSFQKTPVVLLGDLNVTPWSPVFQDLLSDSGLRDSRDGMEWQPTWPTMFPLAWIPIDHCLISSGVFVQHRQVGPNIGSDHYPLVVDFSIRSGQFAS